MDDVVGDENYGDAPLACLQNDTQNVSRLFDPKRGGRLVKDQHVGSKMDGASNCQRLAFASRQTADKTISIVDTSYPEVAYRLDGDFIGALAVQAFERPPTFLGLFANKERASDAHQRKRPAKLVDGRNAMVAGVARAVEDDGFAVHFDRTRRRLMDARQDLDQGRFPGAIVAQEAQDLARLHLERDIEKNVDRTERLVDVGEFEQRCGHLWIFPLPGV